ncbi:MAG: type II toxin-antitoxin system VapC family toxin [Actinomycetota bacterium]|nr:type II toxin-antitoxin system VapC family toxin [Actinomycetota bacterium]MDP9461175.1 type II toxin-antitoxin system VapC family toxin [Actinomycetota bacterium]
MIYLDSSAVVKLLLQEAESDELESWLTLSRANAPVVSSALTRVEVLRACRRVDQALLPPARDLLRGIDLVPMDTAIVETAAELTPAVLRSLDALHLATAIELGAALDAFVAYDARLAVAARDAGLMVVQPGI